jgi:hypothetical protein
VEVTKTRNIGQSNIAGKRSMEREFPRWVDEKRSE